jgi:hypothetical protein
LYPNLRPWSVRPNESSFCKIGHVEQGSKQQFIDIYKLMATEDIMLLAGTCIAVGLIIIFMTISLSRDQVSMTEVINSNVENIGDLEK